VFDVSTAGEYLRAAIASICAFSKGIICQRQIYGPITFGSVSDENNDRIHREIQHIALMIAQA
jgi:hypothetical protein